MATASEILGMAFAADRLKDQQQKNASVIEESKFPQNININGKEYIILHTLPNGYYLLGDTDSLNGNKVVWYREK